MWTHHSARHLITGNVPLTNPAARDHSLQYIAAIGLVFGRLTAADYEENVAADARVDALRYKMNVSVEERYTDAFHDPERRANPHGMEIEFNDGSRTERVEVLYHLGHPRRRAEGIPLLVDKFKTNLARRFPAKRQQLILENCVDQERLERTPVQEFMGLFAA
jgi:2-methylcitrate dehydratase